MYFRNFPIIDYKFGEKLTSTQAQALQTYVDVLDQIANQQSVLIKQQISAADRPDLLSYKIYGTDRYYWTFFLLNDNLREFGWPISELQAETFAAQAHPNTTLVTQEDIFSRFDVGQVVEGQTSGQTATIIKRDLDFGQIVVQGSKAFSSSEIIRSTNADDVLETATLVAAQAEYLSTHHYEDEDGNWVDVDPFTEPPAQYTPITYQQWYKDKSTNSLIRVIKPENIAEIDRAFQTALIE